MQPARVDGVSSLFLLLLLMIHTKWDKEGDAHGVFWYLGRNSYMRWINETWHYGCLWGVHGGLLPDCNNPSVSKDMSPVSILTMGSTSLYNRELHLITDHREWEARYTQRKHLLNSTWLVPVRPSVKPEPPNMQRQRFSYWNNLDRTRAYLKNDSKCVAAIPTHWYPRHSPSQHFI